MSIGILFSLLVLALLIWGLRSQKKQKTEWIKEERYDESGAWLDKRTGERGTYGSLDEEMEQERQSQSKRLKINELTHAVRAYCFEEYPGFAALGDIQTRECLIFIKTQTAALVAAIEKMAEGQELPSLDYTATLETQGEALKKRVLDFAFDNFPKLLDLEIEVIKKFDRMAGAMVGRIVAEIERQKILFSEVLPDGRTNKI